MPAAISGIIAFLQALPKIILLIERIGAWMIEKKFNAWLDQIEETIDKLEKADTPEKKRDAARNLVSIVRNLK